MRSFSKRAGSGPTHRPDPPGRGTKLRFSSAVHPALLIILILIAGCTSKLRVPVLGNLPPSIDFRAVPQGSDSVFYSVRFQWTATDPDGWISHALYAVDPPVMGDTVWVRTEELEFTLFFRSSMPPDTLPTDPDDPVISSDYHVFVIKVVDDQGAESLPVHLAFTSYTVAPQSRIVSPLPSRLLDAITAHEVTIRWEGTDPDGISSREPVRYKFRLFPLFEVQEALALGTQIPSPRDLQRFFESFAPGFATWDSIPGDSTAARFTNLELGTKHYFALTAIDEAGAYEPRFLLDSNVLQFRPLTSLQPPRIAIFNSFFFRQQPVGGFSLDPEEIVSLEVADGDTIPLQWFATPGASGISITGYRWALDIRNIFDETPRQSPDDLSRWSEWSLEETSAVVGPFADRPEFEDRHRFYVQARDNLEQISMMVVEFRPIRASFTEPLLVFDDLRGPPDRALFSPPDDPRNHQPFGVFPTEAVLDTLLHAAGGFPYRFRPPGTTSDPGVFAGFPFDTLDYRFFPFEGMPLGMISRYRAVVVFTGAQDAIRNGDKFSSVPRAALRALNTRGFTNTMAVYLEQGGNVWLFGDGILPSIGNGYVSRFGQSLAPFPYTAAGDGPSPTRILWPGNFLYDFMKIRSEADLNTRLPFSSTRRYVDLIPNLPAFRTPGAPCPLDDWEGSRGAADDPRVSCAAARNLPRWDGLPRLTITTEFPDWPTPLPASLAGVPYVSKPLHLLEGGVSRLDTLYFARSVNFELADHPANPDGKPVFFHYWGSDHGQLTWTGVPLWMFEREQLRQVADRVLGNYGITRSTGPARGPGSANRHFANRRYHAAR